jgi:CRP-like cAMP-binding protein
MSGPGESFGELHLFDDAGYAASAIANKETVILRLQKATFRQLLREDPELHFAFSKLMAQRMRFKFLLLKELACGNPSIVSLPYSLTSKNQTNTSAKTATRCNSHGNRSPT